MIAHSRPWINHEDRRAVDSVLRSRMVAQGEVVRQFEDEAGRYLGLVGGVAAGSGTAALTLALRALQLGEGAEVVIPTYVCSNVVESVWSAGYVPVPCDAGEEWNMTLESVAAVLSRRTRAIVLVHTFGIAIDTQAFRQFELPIIEDACQAFGARVDGRPVGTMGDVGVVSFHGTKCLTTGEGGMAISPRHVLVERMRELRDGKRAPGPRIAAPMSDLQAALGLNQLRRYDQFLARRKRLAERYFRSLSGLQVRLPLGVRDRSIFFRFPVRAYEDFAVIQRHFAQFGVHIRRGVDALLHHTVLRSHQDLPGAERLYAETVSLPIYPALTLKEQDIVIDAARGAWGNHAH